MALTQINSLAIKDAEVKTADIAADAITGAKVADDALDSEHYTDGSIDAAHLSSDAVSTAKIQNDAVTGAKIADDALDSEHYADGSIDAVHLSDDAVSTAKIQNDAVTEAKIADASVDEARLKISNSPTNGHYLQAQSGNTGGLTWAAVSGGGISEMDCWRLTSNIQHSSSEQWFTSGWERQDNPASGSTKLGTGMTESSGVFNFPSTGFWLIYAHWRFQNTGAEPEYHGYLQTSTDTDGSPDWYFPVDTVASFTDGTGTNYGTCTGVHVFDVTNTTHHQVRLGAWASSSNTYTAGHTNQNITYVYFVRLADT